MSSSFIGRSVDIFRDDSGEVYDEGIFLCFGVSYDVVGEETDSLSVGLIQVESGDLELIPLHRFEFNPPLEFDYNGELLR